MKQTKKIMTLGVLSMAAVGMMAAGVSAFPGGDDGKGKDLFKDNVELQDAIATGDYEDFVNTLAQIDAEAAERISETDFERIVEGYELRQEIKDAIENEDYDAFVAALAEKNPDAAEQVTQEQFDEMIEQRALHDAVKQAVEDGDYDTWARLISETPHGEELLNVVSEDDFSSLQRLHELKESGDREGVKELAQEMGLPKPPHKGMKGHGMHGEDSREGSYGKSQREGQGQFSERNFRQGPSGQQGFNGEDGENTRRGPPGQFSGEEDSQQREPGLENNQETRGQFSENKEDQQRPQRGFWNRIMRWFR